jgi:peptide/nickel transport system ATP-binding protein
MSSVHISDRTPEFPASDAEFADTATVASARDLHVTFRRGGKDIQALRGISLDIQPAEILGLVGESGSGKSVLGLSMLGLLPGNPRTSGSVTVQGVDMLHSVPAVQRKVRRIDLGAVFQDPMTSLNPTMKIGRQVIEAAGTPEEAERLLAAVGIPDPRRRMSSYPHELSGGLRQRVMIAIAVAGNPSLVIADEPTTALDVTVQGQVLSLLRSLRDGIGCSVLMVTHDLGVAAQISDRVAVMYAGRLAEVGPTREVLSNAAHPYTLGLMRSRLSLHSDKSRPLLALAGEVPNPANPPSGCAFASRCVLAIDHCTQSPAPGLVATAAGHSTACIREPERVRAELGTVPGPVLTAAPTVDEPAPRHPETGTPAVFLRHVTKSFRVGSGFRGRSSLRALRRVSLEIEPGESVALVGESGSGKSTLLRVVAGLEKHDGGEVRLSSGARPQMVFQDAGASLTPWLTVGELIGERLRGNGLSRADREERVRESLARVGLPAEVAKAKAAQLSGGQRQRVSLARATVIPPDLLLCDEPTSALDVSLAASVLNLIKDLRAQLNMSVLFVTHDLSVARVVADRIAVMYLGQLVEVGTADEITRRPAHPYTQALVASIPEVDRDPPALRGEPASPLKPPDGCSFHPRCPIAVDSCSQPELEVRLTAKAGSSRQVACTETRVI